MNCKPFLIVSLTIVTVALTGCSYFTPKRNHPLEMKHICQNLNQQISVKTGHNINMPNDTPINRVKLYRQYQHYDCDEVLKETS